ncbi:hypothetical protein TRFO_05053 [Tritrichomonas foetus]|uniref:Uncharacterized protein n=1 Tax=Tritrichomonas foetus TaxID=1144522 RepID=A0A1J4KAJ8_9EUKA|nr:hypothetical protein TRFO_05053 [Tritrichomonas foetus]|eukprot:OHT07936.1 hypothetical protein TRFO_05053 [Tritrichomonas foetus]
MTEESHPITEPKPIPHKFMFSARIPTRIYEQIQEGYTIQINPRKHLNDPQTFDLINQDGQRVGSFQAAPEEIFPKGKESQFDSVLKSEGDSFVPSLPIPPDFTFKTDQTKLLEIREHSKKHSNMGESLPDLPSLPGDMNNELFRDWSAKKAYDSLNVMKQRFQKDKKSISQLLDEFQRAINANPQILADPTILQRVSTDINDFLGDMKNVTKFVNTFSNANSAQIQSKS